MLGLQLPLLKLTNHAERFAPETYGLAQVKLSDDSNPLVQIYPLLLLILAKCDFINHPWDTRIRFYKHVLRNGIYRTIPPKPQQTINDLPVIS